MLALPKQRVFFRFYAELNDFLSPPRRFVPFVHRFELPAPVKDMIESMGVPHTEIDLILLNGTPVAFSEPVQDGDRVSVYPAFRSLDVGLLPQLRPALRDHQFVLDSHLGRLARYLRLLGFDTVYEKDSEDKQLARVSHDEQRILLTRDTGLLKRGEVVYGYFVRATEPKQQTLEVIWRFALFSAIVAFQRCLRCNTLLKDVPKEAILNRLKPKTRQHYDEFRICSNCHRIYWAGSHYERMQDFVRTIMAHPVLVT